MLITGEDNSEYENEDTNDETKQYEEEEPSTALQPHPENGGNDNTQDEQDYESTGTEPSLMSRTMKGYSKIKILKV